MQLSPSATWLAAWHGTLTIRDRPVKLEAD